MTAVHRTRSAWSVTLSAWKALFLREALARMFGRRSALLWLMLEPMAHLAFMVFIFTVLRVRQVGGIDTPQWLLVGMLSFFLFRRVATQGAAAIGANLALFTYRQVRPVDTVLVRCALEGVLMLLIAAVVLAGAALWGVPLRADAPLTILSALGGLWVLALGFGLFVSVLTELTPEVGNMIGMLMMPLYLISGVIFPLSAIPYPYREWILLNPVAHGVEGVRSGVANFYHAVPELDLGFLWGSALVLLFLGLALQVRHRRRLAAL